MFLLPKILEWFPGLRAPFYPIRKRTAKTAKTKEAPDQVYPTKPGVYWVHREKALRAEIMDVRSRGRRLVVHLDERYLPVTEVRGLLRGPIQLLPMTRDERGGAERSRTATRSVANCNLFPQVRRLEKLSNCSLLTLTAPRQR